jgi:hypothetical protein
MSLTYITIKGDFLPILVCEKCNTYYEIHSKGELMELGNCECGTKLQCFDSLEDYYNEIETTSDDEDEFFSYLLNTYESAVAKIILYCVHELPFHLGVHKLISVLRGGKASVIIDYKLNELNSSSSLSHFSAKRLTRYIETLERRGLLETELVTKFKRQPFPLHQKEQNSYHLMKIYPSKFIEKNLKTYCKV